MRWLTAQECIDKKLNLETEYPESATLFRCLLATGSGGIGALVAAATMITTSTKLSDILERFAKASRALAGVSPQDAKRAVEPLQKKVVFPIFKNATLTPGEREYDVLAILNRKAGTPWFIADRHYLRESFLGHVDLLAFATEDLERIEVLTKALGLDARKLSALVRKEAAPYGDTNLHHRYTRALLTKAPFITA